MAAFQRVPLRSFTLPRLAWLALCMALAQGCNDLQSPNGEGPDHTSRYNPAAGALDLKLEAANGGSTSLQLVSSDVRFEPATHQLYARVSVRNTGTEAVPGPEAVLLFGFQPTNVVPVNATCDQADSLHPGPLRACRFDYRGAYGSDNLLSAGERSLAVEWILLDPSDESFAFHARLAEATVAASGEISGVVFEDRDRDALQDVGEPGLAQASLSLRYADNATSSTSDAQGRFRFQVDAPGLYELSCAPPAGWTAGSPSPLQVVIVRRPDGSLSAFQHGDFGCTRQDSTYDVAVHGFVYEDRNRNGVRDAGEPGLAAQHLVGTAGACGAISVAATDSSGHYSMALADCGAPWSVSGPSIEGYTSTSPKSVLFTSPPPAGQMLRADFGLARKDTTQQLSIKGAVFRDDNANGIRDAGEPTLTGVQVSATGLACASPGLLVRTDEEGRYKLRGRDLLCALPWEVRCEALPGAHFSTPNPVRLDAPPLDGNDTFRIDFGLAPDATPAPQAAYVIQGAVFVDQNRNGVRDAGEPGVFGAEVQLESPCALVRSTHTDLAGHYRFEAPAVGACLVTAVWQSLPDFDKRTTPAVVPVNRAAPESGVLDVDFGVRALQ